MADALISAEHFYVNASFYNDTDVNQDAVIHVTDNADIINRDDSWLVHITRFSCDSMASLAYIEADSTAKWTIQSHDGANRCTDRFDFELAKDYATPADLIDDMNLKSRYKLSTWEGRTDWIETYRFELDAGGRFRLVAQPTNQPLENIYITYTGTASMNKLLGFTQASPFLRYAPQVGSLFCRAVDFLEKECKKVNVSHFADGTFHKDVNNVLVPLLNGLSTRTCLLNGHVSVTATPNTDVAGFNNGINLITEWANYKGARHSPHDEENEALLPKGGVPMISEWYDIPGTQHVHDEGPKAAVRQLDWVIAYNPTVPAEGVLQFKDIKNPGAATQQSTRYPLYNPQNRQWTNIRYHYPLDSLAGYYYSGYTGSQLKVVSIVADDRSLTLNKTLPSKVEVGDDLWITEPLSPNQTTDPYALVFQIESITNNRSTVTLDHPFGAQSVLNTLFGYEVIITDRRIPFQSRSRTWEGVTNTISVLIGQTLMRTNVYLPAHNATVGDTVYWVHKTTFAIVHGPFPITAIESGIQFSYTHTQHIDHTNYNVFIKKAGDLVRWAKDAKNLKMSPTTFSYENHVYIPGDHHTGVRGFNVQYGDLTVQNFDEDLVHRQIRHFNAQMDLSRSFSESESTNHEYINEEIDGTVFEIIPSTAHIVNSALVGGSNTNDFLDLGSYPLNEPHLAQTNVVLQKYGLGEFPVGLIDRFPQPFWGIQSYHSSVGTSAVGVTAFVKAHPDDQPHMFLTGTGPNYSIASGEIILNGGASPGIGPGAGLFATYCVGVREVPQRYNVDYFMFWSPGEVPNRGTSASTVIPTVLLTAMNGIATRSQLAVCYGHKSKPYNLANKEMSGLTVAADEAVRLFGWSGDHISSALDSQIDHIFPYRQLIITSDDLQQIPERSQDAASRQPILSSYTLSTMISTAIDAKGSPAGGSSQAFGTVYFSESGARRYHHLVKVGGGMRQFRLHAALTYKDHSKSSKVVSLAPGGQFTAQLLFMKKEEV